MEASEGQGRGSAREAEQWRGSQLSTGAQRRRLRRILEPRELGQEPSGSARSELAVEDQLCYQI